MSSITAGTYIIYSNARSPTDERLAATFNGRYQYLSVTPLDVSNTKQHWVVEGNDIGTQTIAIGPLDGQSFGTSCTRLSGGVPAHPGFSVPWSIRNDNGYIIEFKSQQLFWAINHATSNCIITMEKDSNGDKRHWNFEKVSDKASSGIPIPIPPAPDNPAPPAPIDPPTPAPIDQPTPAPVDPPAPVPAPAPAPAPADSATPAPAGIPTSGTVQAWIMAWDNGDITSKFVLNVSIPNEETGIPVLYTFNVNSDVALHRFKSQDAPQEKKLTASYTSLDQFLGYDRFNGSIGGGRIFIKTEKGVKVKGAIEGGPGDGQTFTGAGTWARS